jgi:DNA polymerase-3 subunit delta
LTVPAPSKPAPSKPAPSKKHAKVLGPAILVRGDDPSLIAQAVHELVNDLVGDRDPTTVVEEHNEQTWEAGGASGVIDALSTPPFLTDRRIIVLRDAGRIPSADASRIAAVIADPAPGVILVAVAGGGTVATSLSNAIAKVGTVTDTKVGTGRAKSEWLHDSPVKLDSQAAQRIGEHLGEDLGRLEGLLETLASAYGESHTVTAADVEPFLGTAGGVAPWDLTDALDKGDSATALGALERSAGGTGGVPLVVLASLHRHYGQMLRLDGSDATSASEAASLIGARSEFVAKKALEQSRRLGSERIARAITLIADADLDLRGRTALPDKTVLQVLIARLSRLAPARSGSAPRRQFAGGGRSRRQ